MTPRRNSNSTLNLTGRPDTIFDQSNRGGVRWYRKFLTRPAQSTITSASR